MFDISCNLACRTCGPTSSTYWLKQLNQPVDVPKSSQDVIQAMSKLDLSNLQQVVFCGGETLLGQAYWSVAEWLADNVPNADKQLTMCFQTNGTQSILPQNYEIIKKYKLCIDTIISMCYTLFGSKIRD
jgi:sulfatase maturation enzyme AslB (radical SAM superfamily)